MFDNEAMYQYSSVIDAVVHEGITAFRKKGSKGVLAIRDHYAAVEAASENRKGVQFVVRDKGHLQMEHGVKGFIVTSQEALLTEADKITHWTPNVFRWGTYTDDKRQYIKGFDEQNLQQINTFVVDVDTQQVDVAKMLTASMKVLDQTPTFILHTTAGFQLYFVLDAPTFISNANQFKGLRVAKRIAKNIKHAFANELPNVDCGCNDFGFFRAPNTKNVAFLNLESKFQFQELMNWSKEYTAKNNRPGLQLVSKQAATFDATQQPWFDKIVHLTNVQGRKGQLGRNNVMFTLALACYSSGRSKQEALDLLDQFNSRLQTELKNYKEIEKVVHSAYSKRYKGANLEYIESILETYDSGSEMEHSTPFIFAKPGNSVFRKHKKAREVREYSHFAEWESDLESYLEKQITAGKLYLEKSQRELAEETKIPYASLKKVLKQSSKIISKVQGKGRYAKTLLTTIAIVTEQAIRHALDQKKVKQEKYRAFVETFASAVEYVKGKVYSTSNAESLFVRSNVRGDRTAQLVLEQINKVYQTSPSNDLERSRSS
ncbi:plasmid replication protein [Listeria monocytogenes]|nr:plasmid replication protein [Listeria monocytogenes]EEO6613837.1 plasmid replication protein [Listeria monocytogenes]